MKINLFVDKPKRNETIDIDDNLTVKQLLKQLNINPVTVITAINDHVVNEDTTINDNDSVKILSVLSGG